MYIKTDKYDSLKKELPKVKENNLKGIIVSYEKNKINKQYISTSNLIDNLKIININHLQNLSFLDDDFNEEEELKKYHSNPQDFLSYHKCFCTSCNHFYEVLTEQEINLQNFTTKNSVRFNMTKIKEINYIDNNGSRKLNTYFNYNDLACPLCKDSTFYFDVPTIEKITNEIDSLYIINTEDEFKLSFYGKNNHIFEIVQEETFDTDYYFFCEEQTEEIIERNKKFMKGKTVHSRFFENKYKNNATVYLSKTNCKYRLIYKKKTNKLFLQSENNFHNIKLSLYGEYVCNALLSTVLTFVEDKEIIDIIESLFEEILLKMPLYQQKKVKDINPLSNIKKSLEEAYEGLKVNQGDINKLNDYNIGKKLILLMHISEYPFYLDFYNDFNIKIVSLKEDISPYQFKKICKEVRNTDELLKFLYPSMNKKVINEYKAINKVHASYYGDDTLNIIAYIVLSSDNKGFVEKELLKNNKLLLNHLKFRNSLYAYESNMYLNKSNIRSILKYFKFNVEEFITLINKSYDFKNYNYENENDYYIFVDTINMMLNIRKKIIHLKERKNYMDEKGLDIFKNNFKHFKVFLKSKKTSFIEFHNQLMRFDICFSRNNHVVYDNYKKEDRDKEFKLKNYSLELPKTYIELAQSAIEMHICSASYTNRIEDRKSVLYYIYDKSKPIVCIEYNPKKKKVIQIKKSFNQLINLEDEKDASLLEFIKKWQIKNSIKFDTNDLKI